LKVHFIESSVFFREFAQNIEAKVPHRRINTIPRRFY